MRIVSLCPSNTDIVFALGGQHMLVGVDHWSLRDKTLTKQLRRLGRNVVDVGTDLRIDVDAIRALQPDLVLASLSVPGMEANIDALDKHRLPYIIVDGHTLEGVGRGILQVAEALGLTKEGAAVVATLDDTIAAIRTKAARARSQGPAAAGSGGGSVPRKVSWEWWPNPIIVAGRNSWIQDFFDILGVENAFADLEKESRPVEMEEVLRRNPDTVCACWCGTLESRMTAEKIAGRPGWEQLAAVKEGRIFLLPEKLFGRPGPHLIEGLEMLYELFYGNRDQAVAKAAAEAGLAPAATKLFPR